MKHLPKICMFILMLAIIPGCGPVTPLPPQPTAQQLQDFAYQLTWSPDDRLLAASSNTGLYLLDTKTYKQVAAFPEAKGADVAFGSQRMAASNGQTVRVWDLQDHRQIFETKGDVINFQSIAISRDDSLLATGEQGRFRLWSLPDGALLAEIPVKGFVSNATFTKDNHLIVILQYKAIIQTWDVKNKKLAHSFEIPQDVVFFTLGRDGETMLLDFNAPGFVSWDIPTGKRQHSYRDAIGAAGFTRLSGDSQFAVIWGYVLKDGMSGMGIWDLSKDQRTLELTNTMVNGDGWRCGALNSDAAMLAASNNEGFIYFYNVASGEKIGEFSLPYTFDPSARN